MSKVDHLEARCRMGHVTEYPTDSPFSLCEHEGGPRALWRCPVNGCNKELSAYHEVGPTARWVYRLKEKRVVPEIDAFLADIEEVCKKHNLDIGHEDGHGAFKIIEYGGSWIESAKDGREK